MPYQITSSGRTINSLPATLVWDGKKNTIWRTDAASPPSSAWVYVNIGAVRPIGSIKWVFGKYGMADSMRIEVSSDKKTWTTLATRGNKTVGAWQTLATKVKARYVRFYFTNPKRDPQVGGLGEVQILPPTVGTSGTSPTATPIPTQTSVKPYNITGGSQSLNSLSSTLVRDGKTTAAWKTKASSPPKYGWVYVDLSTPKKIGSIRWVFAQTGMADNMRIQVSSDKTSWTTIASKGNKPVNVWQSLTKNVTARYVRFYFTNPNSEAQVGGLGEVQILPPTTTASDTTITSVNTATSTPISTPTPSPTETPTTMPTPTSTLTEEPTATPTSTVEPSPTETETPTEEPTAPPTETATAEPTIEATTVPDGDDPATVEETLPAPEEAKPYRVVRTMHSRNADSGSVLLDGDPATYWVAELSESSTEATVTLDLGAPKPIGTIRWLFAVGDLADGMRIEVAQGRRDWTTLTEPGNAEPGEWQEFVPGEPATARFVRFTFVSTGADGPVGGLAEVEIWP
jgi:hypothetical protein